MTFPQPSTVINCTNLSSCFQTIYNFLFAILIAWAFIYFLYGAFQYLLSAGGVYSKEEGKNKMKNSVIAVIISLSIPIILNMINPEIFKVQLRVPIVTVTPALYVSLGAVEISEKSLDTSSSTVQERFLSPTGAGSFGTASDICRSISTKCDVKNIFTGTSTLTNISFANNDNGTEYINPALKDAIINLDKSLKGANIKAIITDGYSVGDHASSCHTVYGTCIDVVTAAKPPTDSSWDQVISIARSNGFAVLDERYINGSKFSTGAHLHLEAR